jgi:DNA-binding CsgD family transcriptional regulator
LTAAEAEVAFHLHAGSPLAVVAAQLSISVATVRSHLKRVFMKCNVNSQAKLVRLLSIGPRF